MMNMESKKKFNEIYESNDAIKIWEVLDNGCYIGTLGYTEENIEILLKLLKSFEEQYGEEIDYEAAKEELQLYQDYGKLFIYFDENMNPVSMSGCIYNYENETVDFISNNAQPTSLYFYGLSTVPEFRGKGACRSLINYAIDFAKYNGFDLVYARTDLVDSNSEWIMANAGMEVCKYDDKIIAEWVDVTEDTGDFRLHMWMPLQEGLDILPKGKVFYANDDATRMIEGVTDQKQPYTKEQISA